MDPLHCTVPLCTGVVQISLGVVGPQVIFRMYFDGFPEDRHMVMNHSTNFINNIMLVIHFEMPLGRRAVPPKALRVPV